MLGLYVEIEFWGEKIEGCVGVTNGDGGRALKLYLATADGDLSKGPTQLPQTPSGFHADVLNFCLALVSSPASPLPNSQIVFSVLLTVPLLQNFGDETQRVLSRFRFH